jgi:hypothetical protein
MQRRRIFALGLGAVAMGAGAGMAEAEGARHKGYEMPPYTVEAAEGAREIRRYGPHWVAEVLAEGDRTTAIGRGFGALAGYIFGGNATGEKIAMTVPVSQQAEGTRWRIRFLVPAGRSPADLPAPRDPAVRLVPVAGGRMAVERFSGLPVTADLVARAGALAAWARARGEEPRGAPEFLFYDAPMTLPWRRRNEVALPLG